MKKERKYIELDVDFIGNQEPLTKTEEEMLHDYFTQIKKKKKNKFKQKVTV